MKLEMNNYYLTFFKSRHSISHLEVPSQMQFAFQKAMLILAEYGYITIIRDRSGLVSEASLNELGRHKVQELFNQPILNSNAA